MLKSSIQTFCFSCWFCLFPVSLSANDALFHLDYEAIERVARDYIQEKQPDETSTDFRLKSIGVDYVNHKPFHDVATVIFYDDGSRAKEQSLSGNHTITQFKQVIFTLQITPQGEVIRFSKGTSVSVKHMKNAN